MRTRGIGSTCIGAIVLSLLGPTLVQANVFTIDLTDASKKPKINVSVKDKDGNDRELKAIVDTGNSDGIMVNTATATALGLTIGGDQAIRGAGGVTTLKKTNFTGEKVVTVKGLTVPTGQATTMLTISGPGIAGVSLPNDTLLLGQEFLSGFVQTFNPKSSQLTLTALDQLDKKPNVQPKIKPSPRRTDATGTINRFDDLFGLSWGLNIDVNAIDADFVISTGSETSLISEDLATSLGLDLGSLPHETVPTVFGDLDVGKITLPYFVFSGDPTSLNSFGVLPDSFNPDHINVLGTDILGTLGTYQLDISRDTFRAGAVVPEPSTAVFMLFGLLGIGSRRRSKDDTALFSPSRSS